MIVTVTFDQKNNFYSASVTTEADSLDMAYMEAYGEPQIDTVGTIPYIDASQVSQTFVIGGGPQFAYVRSGMPITFGLQLAIDAQAKVKVVGWGNEMKARISTAMANLRTNPAPNTPNNSRYQV